MLRKKISGFIVIAAFLFTNCVFAAEGPRGNIFQKKVGKPAQPARAEAAPKTNVKTNIKPAAKAPAKKEPAKPKIVRTGLTHPSQLAIPAEFGSVKEYWPHTSEPLDTARGRQGTVNSAQSKIIIHIQDAHCNYEAQMNLAKMLEYLYLAHGVTLILVEGGSRSDSLSYMRAYAPKEKRKEVADKYLRSGKICGENYLDIVEDYPIDVFGVEKPELYDANMTSFLKLDEIRDRDIALLDNLRQTANALKVKLYSKEAQDLEAKKKDYTDEKMKFKDYAIYLLSQLNEREKLNAKKPWPAEKSSQGRQGLENMILYDETLALEKKTDLKQTELERGKLLEYLTKILPQEKLKECVAKTQAAKDNKIKQSEYYNYLKGLIPQNPNINKLYPNLFTYIDYLTVFDKIDNESLFKELPALEDMVYTKLLGRNKDAQDLYFISKAIDTFEALIDIKITPDETKLYTQNKKRFKVSQWKDFLFKQAKRYGIATNLDPASTALDNHFAFVDSFYNVARQREDAFIVNSMNAMDNRLPAPQNTAPKVAVLICGGYHTATLTELFKDKGIAYVVVAPNVTTATDKNLYRTVLKEVYTPMAKPQAVAVPATKPVLPGLLRQQNNEEKK